MCHYFFKSENDTELGNLQIRSQRTLTEKNVEQLVLLKWGAYKEKG